MTRSPAVWMWFVVYCVVMAALELAGGVFSIALLVSSPPPWGLDPIDAKIIGSVQLFVGVVSLMAYGAAPFLPRRKWVWVFDLILICFGMTSCFLVPACLALLIFWVNPDTRRFFGLT